MADLDSLGRVGGGQKPGNLNVNIQIKNQLLDAFMKVGVDLTNQPLPEQMQKALSRVPNGSEVKFNPDKDNKNKIYIENKGKINVFFKLSSDEETTKITVCNVARDEDAQERARDMLGLVSPAQEIAGTIKPKPAGLADNTKGIDKKQ